MEILSRAANNISRVIFEYPHKYFSDTFHSKMDTTPNTHMTQINSVCSLLFKQKNDISLTIDDSYTVIHRKVQSSEAGDNQTSYLLTMFVNSDIQDNCYQRDSINSCLNQVFLFNSLGEVN